MRSPAPTAPGTAVEPCACGRTALSCVPMTPPNPSSLRTAREETIDALCRGFAADALTLGELERRLDRARGARSREELSALLEGVAPRIPVVAGDAGGRTQAAPTPGATDDPTRAGRGPVPARPDPSSEPAVRTSSHLAFAVMGGTRRAGRWVPPANMAAVALMGGVELDFRHAILGGDVEINCFAFWGAVEITVPPNVHVDTRGFALMGGFDQEAELEMTPPPGAPVIRINGLAIMGGVDVNVAEREQ